MALNAWVSVRMALLSSTNRVLFHVSLVMVHARPAATGQLIAHLARTAHICLMDLASTHPLVLLAPFPMLITANAPIARLLASLAPICLHVLAALRICPYSIVLAILLVQAARFLWLSMAQVHASRALLNA